MKLKSFGIHGLLIALFVFMTLMTADPWYDIFNSTFLLPNNIENLLARTGMYGLLGIGVAFVIITSGIDLSIGSTVCLAGVLLALFLKVDYREAGSCAIYDNIAADKTVIVYGNGNGLRPGDSIAFAGTRSPQNSFPKISSMEPVQVEVRGNRENGTALVLDSPLPADIKADRIAKVLPAKVVDASTISVADDAHLGTKDQFVAITANDNALNATVLVEQATDNGRQLQISAPINASSGETVQVIPIHRHQRMSIPVALLSVLLIAGCLGLIHGLFITRVHLQPFVVTLCGLLIYRGISRWLANDLPVGFGTEFDHSLRPLGHGKLALWEWTNADQQVSSFGIPYPFIALVVVAIVAAIFLNKTIGGRYLLALGRNEEAARYSGINTQFITVIAYIICTMAAAFGGILFALDSNSVSPAVFGNFYELYAIAAAVLGGCTLRGGEGTILGVLSGTAVMMMLRNLIVLMGVPDTLEFAVIGAVILVSVTVDEFIRRWAHRRRAAAEAKAA